MTKNKNVSFNRQIREKLDMLAELLNELDIFSAVEKINIKDEENPEEILDAIDGLISFAARMARVVSESPDSIYLADKNGRTLMVNKAFTSLTGIPAKDVVGRTVMELESNGFYRPSVLRLVHEEKRPISVLQVANNQKKNVVKGIPIFDSTGQLEMLLSNAKPIDEIKGLYAYVHKEESTAQIHDSEIILHSASMRDIYELAGRIKNTDSTILITGESGVGKGVLARYIHKSSARAENPMIEINCGAIPENLLESELFGYNTGAFTGASATGKEGLIELAEGGTLLLDEISELPLLLQVKLLKVIQDKQVMRIGAKKPLDVDVRIIAATNRDLMQLIQQGTFRADLYYRLNVIPIEIPPLRERKEDIVAAVGSFVKKYEQKHNRKIVLTAGFMKLITQNYWPGNMRELENYVERAVLTSEDGILRGENIFSSQASAGGAPKAESAKSEYTALKENMEQLEGRVVRELYDKYRSSYKVAEALGISQAGAYRKIKKYVKDSDKS